jgi:membrane-anchored glycerophosphoryl diester phosphodiesterase (GDPDase)
MVTQLAFQQALLSRASWAVLTLAPALVVQRAIGFGITFGLGMLFSFLVRAVARQQQQQQPQRQPQLQAAVVAAAATALGCRHAGTACQQQQRQQVTATMFITGSLQP